MVEIKDIELQLEEIRKEYNYYSVYNFEIKRLRAEIKELESGKHASTKKSKIITLQREIDRLERIEAENINESFASLVDTFNEVIDPIIRYITQGLDQYEEAQQLRKEYYETREKLVHLAVKHNVVLKERLNQLKQDIASTDFYKLSNDITDNRLVKLLGLRGPSVQYIRSYELGDREIQVPEGLDAFYKEALPKYESKRENKRKSLLFRKFIK